MTVEKRTNQISILKNIKTKPANQIRGCHFWHPRWNPASLLKHKNKKNKKDAGSPSYKSYDIKKREILTTVLAENSKASKTK